jgi:hypothetical protein
MQHRCIRPRRPQALATDLHWANLTAPLRILDREGWGQASQGFERCDALRLLAAAAVHGGRSWAVRHNLTPADQFWNWPEELRRCCP